ncbi:unnamed protein product, partial [Rotaria sp. Silwood1]
NQLSCPKGWRRLGGSCYYVSNITSTSNEANYTYSLFHSNHSQLMQIRNSIGLFYATYILTKNNFSSLMLNMDPQMIKSELISKKKSPNPFIRLGKRIAELLIDDQSKWQQMKENLRETRIKHYKLQTKVLDESHAIGLRISKRSKKIKKVVHEKKEKIRLDYNNSDEYYHDGIIDDYFYSKFNESRRTRL